MNHFIFRTRLLQINRILLSTILIENIKMGVDLVQIFIVVIQYIIFMSSSTIRSFSARTFKLFYNNFIGCETIIMSKVELIDKKMLDYLLQHFLCIHLLDEGNILFYFSRKSKPRHHTKLLLDILTYFVKLFFSFNLLQ